MKNHRRRPVPKGRYAVYERLSQRIGDWEAREEASSSREQLALFMKLMFGDPPVSQNSDEPTMAE
jgi:hypothetical protein